MCGIFGVVGTSLSSYKKDEVRRAITPLTHRGPDDHGVTFLQDCILGQTRLSIVDLESGHQPMKDNVRDHTITFNGEIYNYRELRATLSKKGHTFSTSSDTEVILKAYQEYGDDCPEHFDGMFAFAIWDNERKRLFIARDRFGKKPFYYTFDDQDNFIFASEIKALFATGKIKGVLDHEAIDTYLALMYIPPWKTVYKNIKVVPPAGSAVLKDGSLNIVRYWQLEKNPISISYEKAKEEVRHLLTESVKKRMIADVEIGSFLSGGVDSTLVTMIAQSFSKTPIKTFSVGYQDYINELPFAAKAARAIGTDHHTLQAKDDMVQELETAIKYFDEPHADSSDFPQYLLSKFTAQKVKVALSGDGADELFLGYGWYTRHKNLSYRAHFKEKVFISPFSGYLNVVQVFTPRERAKLWKNKKDLNKNLKIDFTNGKKFSFMQKINLFDINSYLPGDLLVKLDRASMMASLEVRSPFLDKELVEFSFNLPEKFKADNEGTGKFKTKWGGRWKNKILLKEVAEKYLPYDIIYRKKQGFGPPIKPWMEKESMQKLVEELFINNEAGSYNFLNESRIKKIINDFYKNGKNPYQVWTLTCLELWYQNNKKYFE